MLTQEDLATLTTVSVRTIRIIEAGHGARAQTLRLLVSSLTGADVATAERVRPLLPGTAGAAVLITSRGRLAELAVRTSARVRRAGAGSSAPARA
ncbi:hypothetical protein GCM10023322_14460 [Rugosimonospora acidiphila]|uniref:Helix-turn-helix domain-containing protein n=1 Tax=Rugosimonospora acidiphila TaxID=556531 RepID=A0ABP9RNP9_9ACTN